MKKICESYCLSNREDKSKWPLDKKGFSVKSMYNKYNNSLNKIPYWFIWKAKTPQRMKVFLWLVLKDRILSKENLGKRKWQGNTNCSSCGCLESTRYIFYDCQVATFTWRVIHMVLNFLTLPNNSNAMFGEWLCGFKKNERNLITIGCGAILWTL